jgi:uncharacterized LabA/DUF88 family protein
LKGFITHQLNGNHSVRPPKSGPTLKMRWSCTFSSYRITYILTVSLTRVKFFTAQVDRRFNDPQQPVRQRLYWRAIRTRPTVEIVEGHFRTRKAWLPEEGSIAYIESELRAGRPITGLSPNFIQVRRSEEKGTDVNIATHLVHDAHLGRFDEAVLISNDSDLAEAVRIVNAELGRPVHIFRPSTTRPNAKLQSVATTFNNIDVRHLIASQLPTTLNDARGSFAKPAAW